MNFWVLSGMVTSGAASVRSSESHIRVAQGSSKIIPIKARGSAWVLLTSAIIPESTIFSTENMSRLQLLLKPGKNSYNLAMEWSFS